MAMLPHYSTVYGVQKMWYCVVGTVVILRLWVYHYHMIHLLKIKQKRVYIIIYSFIK